MAEICCGGWNSWEQEGTLRLHFDTILDARLTYGKLKCFNLSYLSGSQTKTGLRVKAVTERPPSHNNKHKIPIVQIFRLLSFSPRLIYVFLSFFYSLTSLPQIASLLPNPEVHCLDSASIRQFRLNLGLPLGTIGYISSLSLGLAHSTCPSCSE